MTGQLRDSCLRVGISYCVLVQHSNNGTHTKTLICQPNAICPGHSGLEPGWAPQSSQEAAVAQFEQKRAWIAGAWDFYSSLTCQKKPRESCPRRQQDSPSGPEAMDLCDARSGRSASRAHEPIPEGNRVIALCSNQYFTVRRDSHPHTQAIRQGQRAPEFPTRTNRRLWLPFLPFRNCGAGGWCKCRFCTRTMRSGYLPDRLRFPQSVFSFCCPRPSVVATREPGVFFFSFRKGTAARHGFDNLIALCSHTRIRAAHLQCRKRTPPGSRTRFPM